MPTFTYSARPATGGDIRSGEVELKTKEEVFAYLHRQKLIPLRSARSRGSSTSPWVGDQDPRRGDLHPAVRHDDQRRAPPRAEPRDPGRADGERAFQKVIREVLYDVESGNTLADAMGKHPKAFSKLFVSMVSAGEAGGILDTILLRLAVFLEKADALTRKVKGAMIYPGVVLTVAVGAVAILLIFVIPTFQQMFAAAGVPLPLPTQIVIAMSAFLQAFWWAVLPERRRLRDPAVLQDGPGERLIDSFLLKFPSWETFSGRPPWLASPGPWAPWSPPAWPSSTGSRSPPARRGTGSSRTRS
jgi:type IV pilus assembly protein PilC